MPDIAIGTPVETPPGFRQGLWRSFSLKACFGGVVWAVLEDRAGCMWFGGGGLVRWDGAQWTHFTDADGLPDAYVLALLEDDRGRLWIGTGAGIVWYDGKRFHSVPSLDGLVQPAVSCLLQDCRGHIWAGHGFRYGEGRGELSCFDGESWRRVTPPDGLDAVLGLHQDNDGRLWIATASGLCRLDGETLSTYTQTQGLPTGRVLSLTQDAQGRLWVGTEKGAAVYDGETFTPVEALAAQLIEALVLDASGRLWVGTASNGLYRHDGAHWDHYTFADGLSNDQITTLGTDRQGHMWCGCNLAGISRYDQGTWHLLTARDGLVHNGVMDLLEDRQGRIWASTFEGISRYANGRFNAPEELPEALQGHWGWWSMAEDRQGTLWFAATFEGGLRRYDGHQVTIFTEADGLVHNGVTRVIVDRHGHIWAGTWRGLSRFDGRTFHNYTAADGLAGNGILSLLEDRQGRIWAGTNNHGISCFDGETFRTYTTADGLAGNGVSGLLEDAQGHIWMGTMRNGISCFDGEAFSTPAKDVGHGEVRGLLQDRRGHMWFAAGGGGVRRFDGLIFQSLDRSDGLPSGVAQGFVEASDGTVWIATEGGIALYRPADRSPALRLKAVVADRRYVPDEPLQLPVSQQLLVFELEGSSLTTPPERLAYAYRLLRHAPDVAADVPWQAAYDPRIEFHNLPEGDYTFEARAVDRDFNYSAPLQQPFTVEPDIRLESLKTALEQSGPQGEFVGHSPALQEVKARLQQIAAADTTVLILGETGTGKGLAARTLHALSPRADRPLVTFACGGQPESLIESELFGHERGAFTGAATRRLGKVELAQGGTLFLDEIGDLSAAGQLKLLRLLEERTFERVGGTRELRADVRVVAATNRDLHGQIADGSFRQDLYYRLQGFEVHLPPLRQRRDDIPLLALYFIGPKAAHLNKPVTGLSPAAEAMLQAYDWPGNVRELQNTVETAVIVCQGETIQPEDLSLGHAPDLAPAANTPSGYVSLEEHERRYLRQVLLSVDWVIAGPNGAARILGLKEATLRFRMKKLGIVRPQ